MKVWPNDSIGHYLFATFYFVSEGGIPKLGKKTELIGKKTEFTMKKN